MTERWLHELRKLRQLEPPAGLWERAVIHATTAGRRQSPRSTGSRRVWSAIAAAAAIALVAAAIIVIRGSSGTGQPPAAWRGGVYTDPRFGWTIRIPAGLHVHRIIGGFRWSLDGVRITSFTPDLSHPNGSEPETGWLRSFPATGVAAQIWYLGAPVGPTLMHGSKFPLRASSFHRTRPYVGGAEPAPAYRSFNADGFPFSAAVWTGPDANAVDERAIWNVIESLRFPSLRQGTSFSNTVYVLGSAQNYPIGSVTVFRAASLPLIRFPRFTRGFYLVHGPRGFYVIDRLFISPNRSAKVTCTVAFGRASSKFYCPGAKLRWNMTGRELAPHTSPRYGWDLSARSAAISTDGHVLVSPSFGPF